MATRAGTTVDPAALAAARRALFDHYAKRSAELNAEVSAYPTPIARCDVQLTRLLEQRGRAQARRRALAEMDAGAGPHDADALSGFLAEGPALEDDADEAAARARLEALLRG